MDDRGAGCGKAACPVLRGAGGNSDKDEAPDADGEPYGEQKLKYPIVRGASSLLELVPRCLEKSGDKPRIYRGGAVGRDEI